MPALYADLNAPITSGNNKIFPVVDPRAVDLGVEGFSFTNNAIDQVVASGTGAGKYSSDKSTLAMPVEWIYVLRDGSLTAPTSGGSNSATFSLTGAHFPAQPIRSSPSRVLDG